MLIRLISIRKMTWLEFGEAKYDTYSEVIYSEALLPSDLNYDGHRIGIRIEIVGEMGSFADFVLAWEKQW